MGLGDVRVVVVVVNACGGMVGWVMVIALSTQVVGWQVVVVVVLMVVVGSSMLVVGQWWLHR